MSNDLRASELEERMRYREYGMDGVIEVKTLGTHGDRVLITAADGTETSLDRDTVVERVFPLPAFQMDVTGEYLGNAYPEQQEYRVRITALEGERFQLTVEDASGTVVGGGEEFGFDVAEGIQKVASTDHGLSFYEDDWKLPAGMDRMITWTLPTFTDVHVELNESQIDQVSHWLNYALGEDVYEGNPDVWEY